MFINNFINKVMHCNSIVIGGKKMKKYEYQIFDLSPKWTLNPSKKQNELIDRLNELGSDGWIIMSGFELMKHTVFMREITDEESDFR